MAARKPVSSSCPSIVTWDRVAETRSVHSRGKKNKEGMLISQFRHLSGFRRETWDDGADFRKNLLTPVRRAEEHGLKREKVMQGGGHGEVECSDRRQTGLTQLCHV